jgi:hypothetical protein
MKSSIRATPMVLPISNTDLAQCGPFVVARGYVRLGVAVHPRVPPVWSAHGYI